MAGIYFQQKEDPGDDPGRYRQRTEHPDRPERGAGDQRRDRGDLLVEVTRIPIPIFKRQETTIFSTVPISFATAALGGPIRIKTVDGEVEYEVKPGTQTDTKVRLRGKRRSVLKE